MTLEIIEHQNYAICTSDELLGVGLRDWNERAYLLVDVYAWVQRLAWGDDTRLTKYPTHRNQS